MIARRFHAAHMLNGMDPSNAFSTLPQIGKYFPFFDPSRLNFINFVATFANDDVMRENPPPPGIKRPFIELYKYS